MTNNIYVNELSSNGVWSWSRVVDVESLDNIMTWLHAMTMLGVRSTMNEE